jgi:hypothetical protein
MWEPRRLTTLWAFTAHLYFGTDEEGWPLGLGIISESSVFKKRVTTMNSPSPFRNYIICHETHFKSRLARNYEASQTRVPLESVLIRELNVWNTSHGHVHKSYSDLEISVHRELRLTRYSSLQPTHFPNVSDRDFGSCGILEKESHFLLHCPAVVHTRRCFPHSTPSSTTKLEAPKSPNIQ